MPDTQCPRIYVAGPTGFSLAGQWFHDQVVVPQLVAAGFEVADPWAVDSGISGALKLPPGPERDRALFKADMLAGHMNRDLMDSSQGVLAVLDQTDPGTASEIGYCVARGLLVVGVRTDFRLCSDNSGTRVNLQVEYFIRSSGGRIVESVDAGVTFLATHWARGTAERRDWRTP